MSVNPESPPSLRVQVLASVFGRITGSEALVHLTALPGLPPTLTLNGRDVSSRLHAMPGGASFKGVISSFQVGSNTLEAQQGDARARETILSYPPEGPIFSGPHLQPWLSTTDANGLTPATDNKYNAGPEFTYHFRSTVSGEFESYDPAHPPPAESVASTTTDAGATVPYIVRREVGAANRGIYEFAVLYHPDQLWTAVHPQQGWNRKLYVYSYGGWNQHFSQSTPLKQQAPPPIPPHSVLIDMALSRGFMVARTTLMQSATNSDPVRAAEALVMLKQRITAHYGELRYTFASGASGGSIMQQCIANQYPGIFQGIIPMSCIHSSWYVPSVLYDCKLLENYFTEVSPELWQNEADRLAVDGHRSEETRKFFNNVFGSAVTGGMDPTAGTGLPETETYHPERNPGGARGTLQDYQVNYLGRRKPEVWTAAEHKIGQGFANLGWDNEGVEYGRAALLNGQISIEQFLDLNEKIGGVDVDNNLIAGRTIADKATCEIQHRGGFVHDFANMAEVAILDLRNPEAEDFIRSHTQFHTWITRDGLRSNQGHAENHVAWMVPGFMTGLFPIEAAFVAMDRWLDAVAVDTSSRSLEEKIRANRPADATDGVRGKDGTLLGGVELMQREYPHHGDARAVAACNNYKAFRMLKPQLKPVAQSDYPGIRFSEEQWGRLQRIFPHGVSDWTKDGVGQVRSIPWLSYADAPGGKPMVTPKSA